MVSNRDLEHVVAQVNVQFEELFKKIAQLEKQIAETGAKNVSKKTRPKTS
jgi:phage shock protein A